MKHQPEEPAIQETTHVLPDVSVLDPKLTELPWRMHLGITLAVWVSTG